MEIAKADEDVGDVSLDQIPDKPSSRTPIGTDVSAIIKSAAPTEKTVRTYKEAGDVSLDNIPDASSSRKPTRTVVTPDEQEQLLELMIMDDDDGETSLDARHECSFSWTFDSTIGTIATTSTTPESADQQVKNVKQGAVEPSLRSKPSSIDDNGSTTAYLGPEGRIITCFRVAEALRIRADGINAPVALSDANKPKPSIEIELFARINLTYRALSEQVFVFEDAWFPNKLPILRAVHKLWQRCKQDAPTLLLENAAQATQGGFLCRAILRLDTNKPALSTSGFHGEVINVRPAEWSEVEEVRSIVEPQYQQL
jgi:hypothetical protein